MAKRKIRESWRLQQQSGRKAAVRLTVRRVISSVLVLGLVGIFIYLIILPIFRPGTYLVYMTAAQRTPENGDPIAFAFEDFASLTPLKEALTSRVRGESPLIFTGLEAPKGTLDQLGLLAQQGLKRNDCVIVMLTAHAQVEDGVPYLKCSNYDASGPERGRVKVEDVLQTMATLPCKTKLVMLDVTRAAWAPRGGDRRLHFDPLLEQLVANQNDPGLYVLTSSRGWERSTVVPALRQSIFGYMVAQGMRGAADVDSNGELRLDELFHFVKENVSALAHLQSDGHASQTPQLFHCDLSQLQDRPPRLLDLGRLEAATSEPDVVADIDAAQTTESGSVLSRVSNYIVGVSGQFGIPSPQAIKMRLRPMTRLAGKMFGGDETPAEEPAEETTPEVNEPPVNPELLPDRVAARRLERAWKLVDRLEGDLAAEPADGAEAIRADLRPAEIAPPLWHSLKEELLWYDQLHYAGAMVDQEHVAKQLTRIVDGLSYLAGEDSAPPPARSSAAFQIAQQKVTPPLSFQEARSLGMVEALAEETETSLSGDLETVIQELDVLLLSPVGNGFEPWLEKAMQVGGLYEEVRLANQMQQVGLDWPQLQSILRVSRLAEKTAASRLLASGWGWHAVESGDRARWEAERLLVSQSTRDWKQRVRDRLLAAEAHYRAAGEVHAKVRRASAQRNHAVSHCHDYIRWMASRDSVPNSPQQQLFRQLCDAVNEMDTVLARGITAVDASDVDVLDRMDRSLTKLSFAHRNMESGLRRDALELLAKRDAGNGWRIDTLRRTGLLSADSRTRLNQVVDDVSGGSISNFTFQKTTPSVIVSDINLSDAAWERIDHRIEMEVRAATLADAVAEDVLAKLATSEPVDALPGIQPQVASQLRAAQLATVRDVANASLETLADVVGTAAEVAERRQAATRLLQAARWRELESFTSRLSRFYQQLPAAISTMVQEAKQKESDQRLASLRAATLSVPLLTHAVVWETSPRSEALLAEWHGYLEWSARRALQSVADADPSERQDARARHAHFVSLADRMANFPPLEAAPDPAITFNVPTEISLETQKSAELFVDLVSNRAEDTPVWLVLQYDTSLMQVTSGQRGDVYHEEQLRDALAAASQLVSPAGAVSRHPQHRSEYPYRPDTLESLPPTTLVPGGSSTRFKLLVGQRDGARGKSKLVVKAVAGPSYLRQAAWVKLPGDQLYDLVIEDPRTQNVLDADTWTRNSSGVLIMPFPNRDQGIAFRLQDRSHRASRVQVELFEPSRRPGLEAVRTGAIDSALATQTLRTFGSPQLLAKSPELNLAADGSILVPLVPVESPPTATAPPPGSVSEAQLIRHGLLLVITDLERQQKTFKQVHFSVKRPMRYVEAQASYHLASEQLTVSLRVNNGNALPPEGIPAKLTFAEPVSFQASMSPQLEMRLDRAGDFVSLLHAPIPAAERRQVTAQVAIDGFPRAFVFRVNCTETRRAIPPEKNLKQVRIFPPATGSMISAAELNKTKRIRVRVEVDAPTQAFTEAGNDFVEVGIDRNNDGDLLDEQQRPFTLHADRQVKLYLTEIGSTGNLQFRCEVDDFEIELPANGLFNTAPYLLGRLTTGSSTAESPQPHVQLIVDGGGPEIGSAAVVLAERTTQEIIVDEQATVVVKVVDALTRVARVEVGFTRLGGDFREITEPWPALPSRPNEWRADGKIPNLALGKQQLWVKAVDAVGNESLGKYEVTVVPPTDTVAGSDVAAANETTSDGASQPSETTADDPPKPTTTTLIGRLRYGQRVVTGGTVRLLRAGKEVKEVKADSRGSFRISGVAAGEYTLQSRGVAGGNNVKNEHSITIEKPDGRPLNLSTIQLR